MSDFRENVKVVVFSTV